MAAGPVVVADLIAQAPFDGERVAQASSVLWALSGIAPPEYHRDASRRVGDALLSLGQAAAAWALAALNEVRGDVQHAGAARAGDGVRVWLGFHSAELSRFALQLALKRLMQDISGQADEGGFKAELDRLWRACRQQHPDFQARMLMVGARSSGLPFLPFMPGSRYWQFGWGAKGRVFFESASNADGALGWQWQSNKVTAKALLQALGMPTPAHALVSQARELAAAAGRVGFPCVVKPLDRGGGKGVTANITRPADLDTAFDHARQYTRGPVMVEAHVPGDDHRLMVIDGRLVAAIRREPSFVLGDGRSTVVALLAELNAPRSMNVVKSRYLRPIALDGVLRQHLAAQSLAPTDVPAAGRRVTLRSNANLSTGGLCTDVTPLCHPQVRAMAEQLATTTGLATTGIDYLSTDISRAPAETGGAFIELNTTPGLDACVAAGWTEEAIASLVLGPSLGRIPVDLTVLSGPGLEQAAHVGPLLALAEDAAWACGRVLRLGALWLDNLAAEPWAAVEAALRNRGVGALRVVCSSGEIEKLGLPLDRFRDVAVALCDGEPVLPPVWIGVLRRHSGGNVTFTPQADLLRQV
jgi:cyanophycin synthetase